MWRGEKDVTQRIIIPYSYCTRTRRVEMIFSFHPKNVWVGGRLASIPVYFQLFAYRDSATSNPKVTQNHQRVFPLGVSAKSERSRLDRICARSVGNPHRTDGFDWIKSAGKNECARNDKIKLGRTQETALRPSRVLWSSHLPVSTCFCHVSLSLSLFRLFFKKPSYEAKPDRDEGLACEDGWVLFFFPPYIFNIFNLASVNEEGLSVVVIS